MFRIKLLLTILATVLTVTACGSGSNSNSSSASLDRTYALLMDGDSKQALDQVDFVLNQDSKIDGGDGWLIKSQIQASLKDTASAKDSLNKYDALFPKGTGDEFLLAEYEAYKGESGNPQIILKNLLASLNDEYSGIDPDTWWGMIEESSEYAQFRTTTEFQELESLKTLEYLPGAKCKDDKTKFSANAFGTQIYIKHSDMIWFESAALTTKFLSVLLPTPINILVAMALTARDQYVKSRDKGCGIIIHYSYLSWLAIPVLGAVAAETFWATSQK